MYHITGIQQTHSAVVFITIDYKQVPINGKQNLFFEINRNETLNGIVQLPAPASSGKYEVIGFLLYNPLDKITQTAIHFPRTSFRFTLVVE